MSHDAGDGCKAEVSNARSLVLVDEDVRLRTSVRGAQIPDQGEHVPPLNPHGQCGGRACIPSHLQHQPTGQ